MSTLDQVIRILAEQAVLDPSKIRAASSLEELGIDSMSLVESIFVIEETFDISIPFNANNPSDGSFDISSIESIAQAIDRLKAEIA
ncbi:MAG: phosphopantetheine-binding protein [Roseobacter sp.]